MSEAENEVYVSPGAPVSAVHEVQRLKWIFGVTYLAQGSVGLTRIPILYFIKFALGLGDAAGQVYQSATSIAWMVKPLWGFMSDRIPLFGYHRRSWFILMAGLATVGWSVNGALALMGLRVPWIFFVGFNLAFAAYAFVDVVADALMVEAGRRLRRVGAFVNFQWTMLALSNAAVAALGSWLQTLIQQGRMAYGTVFLVTGLPPLATAAIGIWKIQEERRGVSKGTQALPILGTALDRVRDSAKSLVESLRGNRLMLYLVLFVVAWNFSPSVGYVENSYLIDARAFRPSTFGILGIASGLTLLVSIGAYRAFLRLFPGVTWLHYLYAMIALGVVATPLGYFAYLNPEHSWWRVFDWLERAPGVSFLPPLNRYEWFRLVTSTVLGFMTIPALMVPMTLAGEVVSLRSAGMGYAFLMALTNATNLVEGVAGGFFYGLLERPWLQGVVGAFEGSPLNVAGSSDPRTVILQFFIWVKLAFVLIEIPFVALLAREGRRRGLPVRLG